MMVSISWGDDNTPQTTTAPAATPPAATAASTPPATHTIQTAPLKVDVSLSGVVEAGVMTEVSIAPKLHASWIVQKAVAQGTVVKKGDTLIEFDTKAIDQMLRDYEATRELSELNFKQAEEALKQVELTHPIDMEMAERAKAMFDEDSEYFEKVTMGLEKRSAVENQKMLENFLEYEREELKQLEKMYKADDLTEETEEIILKRARNDVAQWEFRVEMGKLSRDRQLNIDLPRQIEQWKNSKRQSQLAYDRAKVSLPAALKRAQLEFARTVYERKKAAENLEELKADRELMTIRAPADGVVYYGRALKGRWQTALELAQRLRPGGMVMPRETLVTIVSAGELFVRCSIPEKELGTLKPGAIGKLQPSATALAKRAVRLIEMDTIPEPDGTYGAKFQITDNPGTELVAGMNGEVKVTTFATPSAVMVPSSAVFSEELDEDAKFVYLVDSEGKSSKHSLTLGHTSGNQIQVLSGLKAGDKILQQKP